MSQRYIKYYLLQSGGSVDEIGPLFHSTVAYQRGRGLGSIFGGLIRFLKPIFSSGVDMLKNQAIKTGSSALTDLVTGANPKQVFQDRGREALKNLRKTAVNKLNDMYGEGIRKFAIKRSAIKKIVHLPSKSQKKLKNKVKKPKKHKSTQTKKSVKTKNKKKKRVLDIFD